MAKEKEKMIANEILEGDALGDLYKTAWEKLGCAFFKEEDMIRQALFYGLRKMLDFYYDGDSFEGKAMLEEILFVSENIYALANRIISENSKYDWLIGLPIKIDGIQKDLDEIYGELRGEGRKRNLGKEKQEELLKLETQLDGVYDLYERFFGEEEESSCQEMTRETSDFSSLSEKNDLFEMGEESVKRDLLEYLLDRTEGILNQIGKEGVC